MKADHVISLFLIGMLYFSGCLGLGEGMTPLLLAARSGDMVKLERALAKGADVNRGSRHGWTALMFASWKGHEDVVARLLDAGADPNRVSKPIAGNTQVPIPKTTALAEAIGNDHFSIAETLISRGASADPIAAALAGGLEDLSLFRTLLAKGADLNASAGVIGMTTPLNRACRNGWLGNVKWMVEHGAKPDPRALKIAAGRDRAEVLEFLLDLHGERSLFSEQDLANAFVHAATKFPKPATRDQNLRVVELLLNQGVDRDYRPDQGPCIGKTVLEYLKQERPGSLARIKTSHYREYEEIKLAHRDAIILLLQR